MPSGSAFSPARLIAPALELLEEHAFLVQRQHDWLADTYRLGINDRTQVETG